MRTLETDRLIIRAFTLQDGDTYARLLDAAFGADSSCGSSGIRALSRHGFRRSGYSTTRPRADSARDRHSLYSISCPRRRSGTIRGASRPTVEPTSRDAVSGA